jgi:FtsH-binding integral membrane protein
VSLLRVYGLAKDSQALRAPHVRRVGWIQPEGGWSTLPERQKIDGMNVYLRNAPSWVLSLYFCFVFAVCMAVEWPFLQHGRTGVVGAAVPAVIGGIVFGAIMGPIAARQWREVNALVGPLTNDAYRSAKRAVMRGPAPADPQIRSAANRLAVHGSHRLQRFGKRTYGVLAIVEAIIAAFFAYAAITSSSWYWAQAILFAFLSVMMAYPVWLRGHLEHRVELLR